MSESNTRPGDEQVAHHLQQALTHLDAATDAMVGVNTGKYRVNKAKRKIERTLAAYEDNQ